MNDKIKAFADFNRPQLNITLARVNAEFEPFASVLLMGANLVAKPIDIFAIPVAGGIFAPGSGPNGWYTLAEIQALGLDTDNDAIVFYYVCSTDQFGNVVGAYVAEAVRDLEEKDPVTGVTDFFERTHSALPDGFGKAQTAILKLPDVSKAVKAAMPQKPK